MEKKYRLNFRMPTWLIEQADECAAQFGINRTDLAELGLRRLVHDIQTERIGKAMELYLRSRPNYKECGATIQMRLPRIIVDYLRFNQYNISVCVREALGRIINRTYDEPWKNQ